MAEEASRGKNKRPPDDDRGGGAVTVSGKNENKRVREDDVDVGAGGGGEGENEAIANDQDKLSRLENNLIFSDTLVALRMMHAQFPRNEKVSIQPFILRSQLYSSVKDRTQVDRDLEALKKEKVLRLFKLNTGQDDHAIMFVDDYLKQIDHSVKRLERKDIEIFEWFKKFVIDSKLDVGIDHQELFSLLSFGGEVKDKHITLLIGAGLLTRQLIDPNMYWFAIPYIGSILKGLSQGEQAYYKANQRSKTTTILEHANNHFLVSKNQAFSGFDVFDGR